MHPLLEISGLEKHYGAVVALRGVDLALHSGEIVGLLGPNGAGKTTTIEAIAGLVAPDAGTILFDGAPLDRALRGRIGLALQATQLQDKITPAEALALFATLYAVAPRTDGLLARFGLGEVAHRRCHRLSGGQRQRLALALAFVADPALVLLDEPTAGLDVESRAVLHRLIRDNAVQGCAVLMATHDMAEAEALCDRLILIDRGAVVAQGRPADLVGGAARGAMVCGTSDRPLDAAALPGLAVSGTAFDGRTGDPEATLAALLGAARAQGVRILSLHVGPPTLEQVIRAMTARDPRP
jgi:ABC-2 type transport system ATP-binding protein